MEISISKNADEAPPLQGAPRGAMRCLGPASAAAHNGSQSLSYPRNEGGNPVGRCHSCPALRVGWKVAVSHAGRWGFPIRYQGIMIMTYRIIKQQGFSSHCSKLRFQDVLCLQDKDIVVPRGRWRAIDVQIVKTLFSVFYQCSLLLFLLHEIMHHMELQESQNVNFGCVITRLWLWPGFFPSPAPPGQRGSQALWRPAKTWLLTPWMCLGCLAC